jgi:hypothetical protein
LATESVYNKDSISHDFELDFGGESKVSRLVKEGDDLSHEMEVDLWKSDNKDHSVGFYKHNSVNLTNRSVKSNYQLLYNFKNSYLFNLGVRNWRVLKRETPQEFSVGGVAKFKVQDFDAWGGANLDFKSKSIEKINFALGGSFKNFNELAEVSLNRIDEGEHLGKFDHEVNLHVESKVNDDLNVFAHADIKSNFSESEYNVGAAYAVDKLTTFKLKANNNKNLTLSLNRAFKFASFNFVSNLQYVDGAENKSGHVKTKFGVGLNFEEI